MHNLDNKIYFPKKIIHIIPSNGFGGVEIAAKSSIGIKGKNFVFILKVLSNQDNKKAFFSRIISGFQILISTYQVFKINPDIVIVSLWKSCISALILKLFRRDIKIILFLHSSKSWNLIDYFFTFYTAKIAYEIWGDSKNTLEARSRELQIEPKIKKRVISFLTYRLNSKLSKKSFPNFIFWGRLSKEKRIDLAIKLFARISKEVKGSRFKIIGPDCGELSKLIKLRDKLDLKNKIDFYQPMDINEIQKNASNSSFFLQLSNEEGLGMSVLESMQLGLIPIVTAVGEIRNYCNDGINSIIYKDINSTKQKIIKLIKNKKEMYILKKKASEFWVGKNTYREDLIYNIELFLESLDQ